MADCDVPRSWPARPTPPRRATASKASSALVPGISNRGPIGGDVRCAPVEAPLRAEPGTAPGRLDEDSALGGTSTGTVTTPIRCERHWFRLPLNGLRSTSIAVVVSDRRSKEGPLSSAVRHYSHAIRFDDDSW